MTRAVRLQSYPRRRPCGRSGPPRAGSPPIGVLILHNRRRSAVNRTFVQQMNVRRGLSCNGLSIAPMPDCRTGHLTGGGEASLRRQAPSPIGQRRGHLRCCCPATRNASWFDSNSMNNHAFECSHWGSRKAADAGLAAGAGVLQSPVCLIQAPNTRIRLDDITIFRLRCRV